MWNPIPESWIKAIDSGFFVTWPGLTSKLVRKYLANNRNIETDQGHLRATRKNIRSTKTVLDKREIDPDIGKKSNEFYTKIIDLTGKIYSDQTGRFPVQSSRGNKYIMVVYDHDSNAILPKALKSRSAAEHLTAIQEVHQYLNSRGIHPKIHIMDNECSQLVKNYIRQEQKIELMLVPPYLHRANAVEKAIDIFKCHFITGLASVDPDFPLHLWCRLLPLASLTLNLLRPSRINPKLSAYEILEGVFDYNRHPIAPPGCKALIHEATTKRKTWDPHGELGWYLGHAPDHYRCHKLYVPKTRSERIATTIKFYPHKAQVPELSKTEEISMAAARLTDALKNSTTTQHKTDEALQKLADIFLNRAKISIKPETSAPVPRVATDSTANQHKEPLARVHKKVTTQYNKSNKKIILETAREKRIRIRNENKRVTQFLSPDNVPTTTFAARGPLRKYTRPGSTYREKVDRMIIKSPPCNKKLPHLIEPDDHLINNLLPAESANAVLQDSGELLEYRQLIKGPDASIWKRSLANDIGRLAQGVGTRMKSGTNTIFFMHPSKIPKGKKVTYVKLVSTIRPLKEEVNRVRVTVGGDRLEYNGFTNTVPAALSTVKVHLNSTISTLGARYCTADMKDFYYGTPIINPTEYEYAQIPLHLVPEEIIKQYDLLRLANNDRVYFEIRKGMPGLKQAGTIANARLAQHLNKHGYVQSKYIPSLWKHKSLPISFTLVVDDFGIKYIGKKSINHLLDTLRKLYTVSVDWKGQKYLGLDIDWDYNNGHVTISMPDYIKRALIRFQHQAPPKPVHSPAKFEQPTYGAKIQYAKDEPESKPLSNEELLRLQQVVGTFLYYAKAVDLTMLVTISDLSQAQANSNESTLQMLVHLLNYAATHPDTKVHFHRSGMILHVHSDGSYLSVSKARSRVGGFFFLADNNNSPEHAKPNGAVHVISTILKNVMSSAAETEIAATFDNAKEAIPLRHTLKFLGHEQPPTPIQVDNTTAVNFAKQTLKQKRSKSIDMRFYWLQDRSSQGQFNIYWYPGVNNLGDYLTKHFSPRDHMTKRPVYLFEPQKLMNMVFKNLANSE